MVRDRMRCVVEHANGQWQAYCADVDLHGTGRTAAEARRTLDRLLERYCYEVDEGVPSARALRRPPVARRLRYWLARLRPGSAPPAGDEIPRSCYIFEAPPQLLVGLA